MKVAVLLSGGKDSVYAAYLAQQYGWDVTEAIIIVPPSAESFMFHHPNARLALCIAEAMGIKPNVTIAKPGQEDELDSLSEAISRVDCRGIITGAIASDYQWSRINKVCQRLNRRCFSPLWRKEQRRVLWEEIHAGFDIRVVAVQAEGLGGEWLGAKLDFRALARLETVCKKHGINAAGEGGEYETIVLNGPNFEYGLEIDGSERRIGTAAAYLDISGLKSAN